MGSGTHLEVVWVGLGRIGFKAAVDDFCVDVEELVGVVAFVVVVALAENGKDISVPRYGHKCGFSHVFVVVVVVVVSAGRGMKPRGSVPLPDQSTRTRRE